MDKPFTLEMDNPGSLMSGVLSWHTQGRGEDFPLPDGFLGDFIWDGVALEKMSSLSAKDNEPLFWVWRENGTHLCVNEDNLQVITDCFNDILVIFRIESVTRDLGWSTEHFWRLTVVS